MHKCVLFLVLTWTVPLIGNPAWGQAPSKRVEAGKKQPNNAPGSAQPSAERGTKEFPLVVDTTGHRQTPEERKESEKQAAESEASEKCHSDIDRWTLRWNAVTSIATGLLVLVGIGGTMAAICTLRKIGTQADEMKLQRIAAQDTLNAIKAQGDLMKRQADALDRQNKAIRDRERARLAVIFPPAEPDFASPWRSTMFDEPELMFSIDIAVHNEGSTKAFGVRAEGIFQFQQKDSQFVETEVTMGLSIPDVIRDADVNNPIPVTIETLVTEREVAAVQRGELDFYVFGKIIYVDVFGFNRTTPFRFLWQVEEYGDTDGSPQFSSSWFNESPPGT